MSGLASFACMMWTGIVLSWWAHFFMKWWKDDWDNGRIYVAFAVLGPPVAAMLLAVFGAICVMLCSPFIEYASPGYFSTFPFGVHERYDGGATQRPIPEEAGRSTP